MSALGLMNGLADLGVTFEVVDGRIAQVGGRPLSVAITKQLEPYRAGMADLFAAPSSAAVRVEVIHGDGDLARVTKLLGDAATVATCEVEGHLAMCADGLGVVVVMPSARALVVPRLIQAADKVRFVSWGTFAPLDIDCIDVRVAVRLLELAGLAMLADSIVAQYADLVGVARPPAAGSTMIATLTHSVRAVLEIGVAALRLVADSGAEPVLEAETRVARTLARATRSGVRFDHQRWSALVAEAEERLAVETTALIDTLGVDIGDDEGLVRSLRAHGVDVASAKTDDLRRQSASDLVDLVLRARATKAFLTNPGRPFAAALVGVEDGRLHPIFKPIGDSGRISASEPGILSIPRLPEVRRCVIPSEGHQFIAGDFAGSQLRIVADMLSVEKLKHLFGDGIDVHKWTAARYLGIAPANVTSEQKAFGKAANFGLLYGIGVTGFRDLAWRGHALDLTDSQARALMDTYFREYPEVRAWHQRESASPTYVFRTPLGRELAFDPIRVELPARLARMVQAIEADALKTAIVDIEAPLADLGGRLVLPIHDALLVEVPTGAVDAGRVLLADTMRRAMARFVPSVPIIVETKVGADWSFGVIAEGALKAT